MVEQGGHGRPAQVLGGAELGGVLGRPAVDDDRHPVAVAELAPPLGHAPLHPLLQPSEQAAAAGVELRVHPGHAVVQADAVERVHLRGGQVLELDAVAEPVGRLPLGQVGDGADLALARHHLAGPADDEPQDVARAEPLVGDERHARVVEVDRDAVPRLPTATAVSYSTGTWTMCRVVNRRSAGQNARCVTLYASQKWSRTQTVGTTGLK